MARLLVTLIVISTTVVAFGADSLPRLNVAPQSVEQLWAGYDPRSEPLEVQVIREFQEDDLTLQYVIYSIGTFKGKPARMAAFYGFPTEGTKLPAVMHMHGGGQRAFLQVVKRYAKRGYAALSVNWGGRPMEGRGLLESVAAGQHDRSVPVCS
jgi:cephalosporin-C deacetylase-like acetyl esterase